MRAYQRAALLLAADRMRVLRELYELVGGRVTRYVTAGELAKACRLSVSDCLDHVTHLVRRGFAAFAHTDTGADAILQITAPGVEYEEWCQQPWWYRLFTNPEARVAVWGSIGGAIGGVAGGMAILLTAKLLGW
jgi:hypothetical protein